MSYTLLYPTRYDITPIQDALKGSGVIAEQIPTPEDLKLADGITVLLLDPTSRGDFTTEILRRFVTSGGAVVVVGAEGETDVPEEYGSDLLAGFLRAQHGPRQALLTLRTAYREAAARADCARSTKEAEILSTEVDDLTSIGMALSRSSCRRSQFGAALLTRPHVSRQATDLRTRWRLVATARQATGTAPRRTRFAHAGHRGLRLGPAA